MWPGPEDWESQLQANTNPDPNNPNPNIIPTLLFPGLGFRLWAGPSRAGFLEQAPKMALMCPR